MLNNDENDAAFLAELGIERTEFKVPTQPTPTPVSLHGAVRVCSIPDVEGYWVPVEHALHLSERMHWADQERRKALRQARNDRRRMWIALAVACFWLLFAGYMAVRG